MSGSWLSATTSVFLGAWAATGPPASATSPVTASTAPILIQLMAVSSRFPGRSVLDAPEQALRTLAVLASHPVPGGHRHLVHAPQLGHRVGVVVHAQVVVPPRLGRGDQERGRLLAALVAAGRLAGLQRSEQPCRQLLGLV